MKVISKIVVVGLVVSSLFGLQAVAQGEEQYVCCKYTSSNTSNLGETSGMFIKGDSCPSGYEQGNCTISGGQLDLQAVTAINVKTSR